MIYKPNEFSGIRFLFCYIKLSSETSVGGRREDHRKGVATEIHEILAGAVDLSPTGASTNLSGPNTH